MPLAFSDRNANTISFAYEVGTGKLLAITDTLGRVVTVAWSGNRVASVTDFAGRTVAYAYYQPNEAGGNPGDLKSARSPLVTGTPNGNDFPLGKTTTYTYSTGFADERLNHNRRDHRPEERLARERVRTADIAGERGSTACCASGAAVRPTRSSSSTSRSRPPRSAIRNRRRCARS
jgi:hypothetical protein